MQYAVFTGTRRYHLTTESGRTTLCGRPTRQSKLAPSRLQAARVFVRPPSGYALCSICGGLQPVESKPEAAQVIKEAGQRK